MAASLAALNYFLPIFAFLFVFIIVYVLIQKSKLMGDSPWVLFFLSFIFATLFIINTSLVEFIQVSSGWIATFLVVIFMAYLVVSLAGGDYSAYFKGGYAAWGLLILILIFFVIVSSYVFNWAVNWDLLWEWAGSDWAGLILLLILGGLVSWKIAPVAKK